MGSLIPNPNDLQIVDALNTRFSGTELQNLRAYIQQYNDDFFAPARTLRRIAWRLNVFPTPTPGDPHKARWLYFLQTVLPKNHHDTILATLRNAVGYPGNINNHCAGIRFWVAYDSALAKGQYDVDVDPGDPDPADGLSWMTITLTCGSEIDPNAAGNANAPPADPGENPNNPPHPALRPRKVGGKRTGKKGGTKKAVKGKAKRVVKKVAKKKGKKR